MVTTPPLSLSLTHTQDLFTGIHTYTGKDLDVCTSTHTHTHISTQKDFYMCTGKDSDPCTRRERFPHYAQRERKIFPQYAHTQRNTSTHVRGKKYFDICVYAHKKTKESQRLRSLKTCDKNDKNHLK